MREHVILDLEIQRTIEETPGGWDATDLLGVSVAVAYEMETDRYQLYGVEHLDALRHRLLKADRVTTFNGWKFDLPVIWRLPQPQRVVELTSRSDDLLRRIWQAQGLDPDVFSKAHGGWGLDVVCRNTIGRGKTGHGADAPLLYQQGRWVELINYCIEDVRLTRDLLVAVEYDGKVSNGRRTVTLPPWRTDA